MMSKHQALYRISFLFVITNCALTITSGKENVPWTFKQGQFYPTNSERDPKKSETIACGAIRDVIKRNSPRFRKVLIRNSNKDIIFGTDDARYMTSRTKSKLDVLASLFRETYGVGIKVLKAWTDGVDKHDLLSLHYEGEPIFIHISSFFRDNLWSFVISI